MAANEEWQRMKSSEPDKTFVRAALYLEALAALIGVTPLAFVGFVAIRLSTISIETQGETIDPRRLVSGIFLMASAFSWLGQITGEVVGFCT